MMNKKDAIERLLNQYNLGIDADDILKRCEEVDKLDTQTEIDNHLHETKDLKLSFIGILDNEICKLMADMAFADSTDEKELKLSAILKRLKTMKLFKELYKLNF